MASEHDWDEVDDRLHDWVAVLRTQGMAGVLHRVEADVGLAARLLAEVDGERHLSDLRHVAELLHRRHVVRPSSTASLAGWLAEQRAASGGTAGGRRRLRTDAEAVTVQTIHSAKGLEFPVVFLPSLWEGPWTDERDPPVFHDDHGARCIGVGGSGPIHDDHMAAAAHERADEEIRLLYVALTRARHRVVLGWATGHDAAAGPFGRLLLGREPGSGVIPDALRRAPTEQDVRGELLARAENCAGAIAVEDATGPGAGRFRSAAPGSDALGVRVFGRILDEHWTRTSYSALTAAAHDSVATTAIVEVVEIDERAKVDEPDLGAHGEEDVGAPGPLELPVPLADVPGGARVGSLVHEMLEHVDFTDADLPAALAAAAARAGARRLVAGHTDAMVTGISASLSTPLGPLLGGRRLCDLGRADRLDEMAFDLPLAGGDTPTGMVTMAAIAEVFAGHLSAADPLGGYPERLADPLLAAEVRGFLTGSIDLVARIDDRHVVVDYKTNRLAPAEEPLTAWHYRPEALAAAMQDAHYPLQAALYAVALHRFLRWRLPDYDPAVHLGGVAYLFLRGMTGPDTPTFGGQPCGVFSWPLPAAFVTDLSDLLDRGAP